MTDDKFANKDTKHSQSNRLAYTVDEKENPSKAVIKAVAEHTDTNILDLDPLYHVIDPDYIDGMFERTADKSNTEISFEFNGCKVKVLPGKVIISEDD